MCKLRSSAMFIDMNLIPGRFSWQAGFGAFTYSHSQLDDVIRYIANQEQHHARKSFREEYLEFLARFKIKYDEKYIFRPID